MKVHQCIPNVAGERPGTRKAFYRDVLGLEPGEELGGFRVGGAILIRPRRAACRTDDVTT